MLALLSEEQELLAMTIRSMRSVVGVSGPRDLDDFDHRRAWDSLVEAGLLGLRLRSDDAPLGSGVDAMIVARGLGEMLCPAPFVPALLATELLLLGGEAGELAEAVAAGDMTAAVLLRRDLGGLATADDLDGAVRWGDGEVGLCIGSPGTLARVALSPIERHGSTGDMLFPLDSLPPEGAVERSGRIDASDHDRWMSLAISLVCADALGSMRAAVDGAIEYSKTRVAFGVPIGSFQAIQHMCADAVVVCEAADAAISYAAWAADELDAPDARLAASTAKAWLGYTGREVTEIVMQVFGGVGQTWEHPAHLYTRRVIAGSSLLGDADGHLDHVYDARVRQY
ncbi:Acyl-CoA dehydrogenase, C-terminal domain [Parafrankia irregularis]|uniref:Acyl-CoA dehydrogenase, C-terminal domain n=1 Tax=Parafrankia irregularis TaxID=795642 RepID=A0A0S4QLL0_9ACTN|nr:MULTISPECIES: acyl-CoA dehydrogenase family protein [Parafrankia]MBE3201349.1 hypothetical protein [Parafrankia sp. CH37]CUU56196.1 Acyl-CoA dehydrogenase, C-terminal domain [Parafrankia irregularis]